MKEESRSRVFGKRSEPHTVIIARGDNIRHFEIRPWVATLFGSILAAMAVGYLLATSYLVLRDDLIDATTARQARLQQAYEDRISALRTQVDRITSRQMLDQQLMEAKVGELLERQSQLTQRHGRIGPILDRFKEAAADAPDKALTATGKPDLRATIDSLDLGQIRHAGLGDTLLSSSSSYMSFNPSETSADRADRLFVAINQSLRSIETEQLSSINAIAEDAYETADAIAEALQDAGLKVDLDGEAVGGPLVALDDTTLFDVKVRELDDALDLLDRMKTEARRLPIANPSPGHSISSTFGVRKDPLLGTPAMHSGMDFRAPTGSDVLVTAPGTVIKAGWNGGYGRMVEVRHAGGFTTRYAHMSRILVTEGQEVAAGDVVGKVGSSGRSTGPHLHYEVHRNGQALNPVRFIKVGRKVSQYL
ncbi:MAG: M23 family metallopeptidase [Rhizobiaceae bacterium]|nr:M23 family metallopeptidase [Rhizobiaceae bacterium]